MKFNLHAVCWATAMLGIATAGVYGLIDEAALTSLLVAMPGAWLATAGRGCRIDSRRA